MLLTLQFPIADLRGFLPDAGGRVPRPNWHLLDPDVDFIRGFGPVVLRPRGGLPSWLGEHQVCNARHALRFKDLHLSLKPEVYTIVREELRLVFARFFSDGLAVNKLEVGFSIRDIDYCRHIPDLAEQLIIGVLDLPVQYYLFGLAAQCKLGEVGKHLAEIYGSKTTRHATSGVNWRNTVRCGRPLMVLEGTEYESFQVPDVPKNRSSHNPLAYRNRVMTISDSWPARLQFWCLEHQNHMIPVWLLNRYSAPDEWDRRAQAGVAEAEASVPAKTEGPDSLPSTFGPSLNYDDAGEYRDGSRAGYLSLRSVTEKRVREVRLYLLRIHAERECLRQVLLYLGEKRDNTAIQGPGRERLQQYLNESTRRILKLEGWSGGDSLESSAAQIALRAYEQAAPGTREAILLAVQDIRPNIRRKVERVVKQVIVKEQVMGDSYHVGQAGAVGPNSHAHDIQFQQVWLESGSNIDLPKLADELATVRSALKQEAGEASEPAQDEAVGEVAKAELAAREGDGPKALKHLASAGKWVLDVATKIGTGVAVYAIKNALHL